MSTSLVQPHSATSWKQEVNLRLAAHRSRRGLSTAQPPAPVPSWPTAGSRGAQVAARVAARYAHAPSYSQLRAAEDDAADQLPAVKGSSFSPYISPAKSTRALSPEGCFSEFSQVIFPIPAAVADHALLATLAGLPVLPAAPHPWESEAPPFVPPSAPEREPAVVPPLPAPHALPDSLEAWESEYSHIRPEPDLRMRPIEPVSVPAAATASRYEEGFASVDEDGWEQPEPAEYSSGIHAMEPVEPEEPIHANLIKFPRELVAVRKLRPRRVEGPLAVEGSERQLSIFEVDPGSLSIQPETLRPERASAWPEPAWSGLKLEAQPLDEPEYEEAPASEREVQLAPIGHRLMATLVDGAIITALFLGSAVVAVAAIATLPAARIMEICALFAFLLIAMVYQTLFLTLADATPGMRVAGISLCTFDGQIPTPAQLRSRLGALLLSVVPMGLGLAWALFDEDHLCWHDRLSRTYLRKN
jgi:uncharacterized RDD family membrane protein YckC